MQAVDAFSNLFGKIASVLGGLALVLFIAVTVAPELHDGKAGIIAYLYANASSMFDAAPVADGQSMVAYRGGLDEQDERDVLVYLSVALSFAAGLLTILAIVWREHTLYLAIGCAAAFSVLLWVNPLWALLLMLPILVIKKAMGRNKPSISGPTAPQ